MRAFRRFLLLSAFCAIAYVIWAVQPDRELMETVEQEIAAADFDELQSIGEAYGFKISRGIEGYINSPDRDAFLSHCPEECNFVYFARQEQVPFLGAADSIQHKYIFHILQKEDGSIAVLADHLLFNMTVP